MRWQEVSHNIIAAVGGIVAINLLAFSTIKDFVGTTIDKDVSQIVYTYQFERVHALFEGRETSR